MQHISHLHSRAQSKEFSIPFVVIFSLTFLVFFVIALVAQGADAELAFLVSWG